MQYRQLPHGGPNETFSVLGLGMGGIQVSPPGGDRGGGAHRH